MVIKLTFTLLSFSTLSTNNLYLLPNNSADLVLSCSDASNPN
ncbi:hypothetical protein ACV3R1_03250 [Clostridium perfringens]